MNWLSYYAFWILAPLAFALVSRHPAILVVAVIAFVARRWIPDPYLFFKHLARVKRLRNQIEVNSANTVARVELAEIYLDKRRPRRAIPLLVQARERDPGVAELRYLLGLAHLRAGEPEQALEHLRPAAEQEPKLRYGSAWLAIGDAAHALRRDDDAIAAYQRYVKINSSSVEGLYKLTRAHHRKKDEPAAARTRKEALDTYRLLPGFQRRKQLGWWVLAKLDL